MPDQSDLSDRPKPRSDRINHARVLVNRNDADALESAQAQAAKFPKDPEVMALFGECLLKVGAYTVAIEKFLAALSLGKDSFDIRMRLGGAYLKLNQFQSAIEHYKEAVVHGPGNLVAKVNLAIALERANQIGELQDLIVEILEIDSENIEGRLIAATVQRRKGDYEQGIHFLEDLRLDKATPLQATRCLFELAQLYDRAERSEEAFKTFTAANRLQSNGSGFDQSIANNFKEHVAYERKKLHRQESLSAAAVSDTQDRPDPTFLIGFTRSGTTLLEQILGAHPDLDVLGEKPIFTRVYQDFVAMEEAQEKLGATVSLDQLSYLKETYTDSVSAYLGAAPKHHFVDKLALNLTKTRLIQAMFPKSKYIFALRHPCDVCLSNFMQSFFLNDATANFLNFEDAIRVYDQVMKLWAQASALFNLNTHIVRYESLVGDFESTTRQIFEFLELDWNDQVLNYTDHAKQSEGITTPSYQDVVQPIFTRSQYRWVRYADKFEPFRPILEPHVHRFGYDW
ncbi:MAG: sulfotransferase [Rhodospirillaceae bacterium]|nr:sulfotransferase [Rhodospirillaceae bacterium]